MASSPTTMGSHESTGEHHLLNTPVWLFLPQVLQLQCYWAGLFPMSLVPPQYAQA